MYAGLRDDEWLESEVIVRSGYIRVQHHVNLHIEGFVTTTVPPSFVLQINFTMLLSALRSPVSPSGSQGRAGTMWQENDKSSCFVPKAIQSPYREGV